MSRLWSRFAARGVAVVLLSGGVAGGFYLSDDRQAPRPDPGAQVASSVAEVDVEYRQEQQVSRQVRAARQQAAETRKRARAAAEKARKAEEAARKAAEEKAAKEKAAREAAEARARALKPYDGPIPESCTEYGGHRKTGCALMIDAGFDIDQFPCLDRLWTKESGWNPRAHNNSSGAHGIPQALPGSKMATVGADWETNPVTQIKWGLGYIKGRHGTPCGAWTHSQNRGWY